MVMLDDGAIPFSFLLADEPVIPDWIVSSLVDALNAHPGQRLTKPATMKLLRLAGCNRSANWVKTADVTTFKEAMDEAKAAVRAWDEQMEWSLDWTRRNGEDDGFDDET